MVKERMGNGRTTDFWQKENKKQGVAIMGRRWEWVWVWFRERWKMVVRVAMYVEIISG